MSEVLSFGCRLNLAESETIRALTAGDDGLVVVNSCAVTREAVRQSRQAVRRALRDGKRVVATGCAVEVEPEAFAGAEIVANGRKTDLRQYLPSLQGGAKAEAGPASRHARAFVIVQNGCDHRCTFCIIPFGRGAARSMPVADVVRQIRDLVASGCNEVVLTGVDVTSWGCDLPGEPKLGDLVAAILAGVPALPRLRLSSLDAVEIDPLLFEIVTGEARLMPHLHLSLQAGDDMILKRMKRRHSRDDAVRLVERLKTARPAIAIGADLIAGFPTETDDMAANTLKLLDDCDVVHAHIFPYSERVGTPAARMPQVAPDVRRARAGVLRSRAAERRARWLAAQTGGTAEVLVELDGRSGHSPAFAPVRLVHDAAPRSVTRARLIGLEDGILMAEAA